jgi:hypothetical protein
VGHDRKIKYQKAKIKETIYNLKIIGRFGKEESPLWVGKIVELLFDGFLHKDPESLQIGGQASSG